MKKLISKQTISTLDTTAYVLSKDLDYAFERMFKQLKEHMRSAPNEFEYTLTIEATTGETE